MIEHLVAHAPAAQSTSSSTFRPQFASPSFPFARFALSETSNLAHALLSSAADLRSNPAFVAFAR